MIEKYPSFEIPLGSKNIAKLLDNEKIILNFFSFLRWRNNFLFFSHSQNGAIIFLFFFLFFKMAK